jgi:hypothetical protein
VTVYLVRYDDTGRVLVEAESPGEAMDSFNDSPFARSKWIAAHTARPATENEIRVLGSLGKPR